MDVLRTPDERFANLSGYDFAPNYVEVPRGDGSGDLRMHYLDVCPPDGGALDGELVLLLHGEPSWSFLYRHMIPPIVAAGFRCVAPDLVGFGKSDKPTARTDYTFARHVEWLRAALFDSLDLRDITLVCQDWGGLLGLRLVGEHPERFARVVTANTFLPTGDQPPGEAFLRWREFSQNVETFPTGFIINGGCTTTLAPEVIAGYDAPFPDETYKEGARQFPLLVPATPDDPASAANRAAWEVLRTFDRPWLCAFSDGDPVTAGGEKGFLGVIPGTEGQPHTTIEGGGHFLQEDRGPELADVVIDFVRQNPR
jgi:haloalkane dehalogenase